MEKEKVFEYLGLHFQPIKKFRKNQSFYSISRRFRRDFDLGFTTYDDRKKDYSYVEFYIASGNSECDIFKCIENNKNYVPCNNELFEYVKEN